jgi:pheromone a factor receptor
MYIDSAIGFGLPVLVMCLRELASSLAFPPGLTSPADTVVQGHRFNIAEDIGCVPDTYITPLTFPLVLMWPVLLGTVSFVYACGSTLTASPTLSLTGNSSDTTSFLDPPDPIP